MGYIKMKSLTLALGQCWIPTVGEGPPGFRFAPYTSEYGNMGGMGEPSSAPN